MLDKSLDQVLPEDLIALKENEVTEGATIDYKLELDIKGDDNKRDFLADVVAFANNSGGTILIGIRENKHAGIEEIVGMDISNSDQFEQQIMQSVASNIVPRIQLDFHILKFSEDVHIGMIRIPMSWNAPHRYEFGKHKRFYIRNTNSKHEMSMDELRDAFILRNSLDKQMTSWRRQRFGLLSTKNTPIPVKEVPQAIMHITPTIGFNSRFNIDFTANRDAIRECQMIPKAHHEVSYNAYGPYFYVEDYGYLQFFRNGAIEYLFHFFLNPNQDGIWIKQLEVGILHISEQANILYKSLDIPLPFTISVALQNVNDLYLDLGVLGGTNARRRCQQNFVQSLEIEIASEETTLEQQLLPLFDSIWNAFGHAQNQIRDREGSLRPPYD